MAFLTTDFSNAYHNILLPYIRDNFPSQKIMLSQLKRNAGAQFINKTFYAPMRSTRHGGVTNLANDGNLTVSGTAGVAQASVNTKIITGAFDISQMVIAASKSSTSAVENALTFQTDALLTDFNRSVNRQSYGDATGIVAQVLTSGGSIGVGSIGVKPRDANLDDGRSTDNYGTVNGDISPVKYLAPGMIIGVGTNAAGLATVSSVTGIGTSSGTIVVSAAVVTAAEDSIFLLDGSGQGAGTMELTGIRAALSSTTGTSTYASVARSTIGWTPQFGSASEALTLSRIEKSYIAAREYSQEGDKYALFMNQTLYRKYGDILQAMRRTVNSAELSGGWSGLEFTAGAGQVGVFLDYDVPDGEVIVMNLDSWTLCEITPMDWMEDPNGGGLLRLSNKIQYQAEMTWFLELLCLAPAANGRETQKTA